METGILPHSRKDCQPGSACLPEKLSCRAQPSKSTCSLVGPTESPSWARGSRAGHHCGDGERCSRKNRMWRNVKEVSSFLFVLRQSYHIAWHSLPGPVKKHIFSDGCGGTYLRSNTWKAEDHKSKVNLGYTYKQHPALKTNKQTNRWQPLGGTHTKGRSVFSKEELSTLFKYKLRASERAQLGKMPAAKSEYLN